MQVLKNKLQRLAAWGMHMRMTRRYPLLRYGASLLLVGLMAWVRWLLPLDDSPFLVFMPGMFAVGFFFGRGPGTLATFLTAFAAEYIDLVHDPDALSNFGQFLGLALYILICIGLVAICDLLYQALSRRRVELAATQKANDAMLTSQASLATSEAFLRSVLESSPDCIKVLDLDARITFMNEQGKRVMEVSDFSALQSCPWPDFWQGSDNAAAKAAIESARNGQTGRFQGFCPTQAGTEKWWDVVVTAILGADGRPEKLLSVSRDITEQKRHEAQQELLNHELSHRLKNTLAMVQAIANQTLRRASSVQEARLAFESRLIALGTAQDVLTNTKWESAAFSAILYNALVPHGVDSGKFLIESGPDIEVSSRCALAMSLALHELATNATKYGALSTEGGRVHLTWSVLEKDGVRTFHFTWQETGGPAVVPPTMTGFGSILIERSLAGYFKARPGSNIHLPVLFSLSKGR